MPDMQAARELKLYIDNDGPLYRAMTTSILKNLVAKKARGQYKHDLAVKGFGYLTEAGAKKYAQEFGTGPWHKMFDVSTRKRAAEELTKDFEETYAEGSYDGLLPKKYQKSGSSGHARKKSGLGAKKSSSRRTRPCSCGARVAGVPAWMLHSNEHARNHDGHRWLTDEQGYILEGPSPSSGHSRKKNVDRVEILNSGGSTYFRPGQFGYVVGSTTRGGMATLDQGTSSEGDLSYLVSKKPKGAGSSALWFSSDALRFTGRGQSGSREASVEALDKSPAQIRREVDAVVGKIPSYRGR
jgi:hypothetical protein